MENIIEISHLDKSYKDVKAVNDLSFKVRRGELFAFLGVNGAGKSTTISVMCGSLEKDGGSIELVDIEGNMVKVRLKGRCAACPNSTLTLKKLVQAKLSEFVSDKLVVEEV